MVIGDSLSEVAQLMFHLDGWQSVMSGMGMKGKDKLESLEVSQLRTFADTELAQIYAGDGIGASMVDLPALDATKNGWEIQGDDKGLLFDAQQGIGLLEACRKALTMTDLYGGALAVMMFDGGGPLETPLNLKSPPPLKSIRVYPRSRIEYLAQSMVADPQSIYFEDFEKFTIDRIDAGTFDVHASRCFPFHGIPVLDKTDGGFTQEERYWGVSVLSRVFHSLAALGSFSQGVGHLGQEFSIGKITISNLEALVAQGDFVSIQKRMDIIALQKSLIHSILLGSGEKYERDTLTFTGIPETMQTLMMLCAGAARIPVTKLFGRSAAGENATGEGDLTNYYDILKARQQSEIAPFIRKVVSVVNANIKALPAGSPLAVNFEPIWVPTPAEQATTRLTNMQADVGYINAGVLDSSEVRDSRFVNGYGSEISVEAGTTPEL